MLFVLWFTTVAMCLGSRLPCTTEIEPPGVRRLVVLDVDNVDISVSHGDDTTVLRYSGYNQQICEHQSQLILILVQDLKHLVNLFRKLSLASCWNARARFLIVPANNDDSNLETVLREAWVTFFVLNLTVMLCSSAVTYNPFKGEEGTIVTVTSDNLFPDKARDLHGHLLIGSVFPSKPTVIQRSDGSYIGPDVELFLTFARYLNATPQFLPPSDGRTYGFRGNDGGIGGSSGDVAYGLANITVNSSYRKLNLSDCLDFSYPHFQDDCTVVVPKAGLVPMDRNLFLPFTSYTWIAILCSIPSAGMCLFLLFQSSGLLQSLLYSYKAFLTGAMPPNVQTTSQRMFLIMWVFCSVVLTSSYQGSLTSYLVVPQNLPDINTLQQLNSSRLTLLGFEGVRPLLSDDSPILTSLSKRFTPGFNTDKMLFRVARVKDAVWIRGSRVSAYEVSRKKFIGSNGQPLLHLMKESLLMQYTGFEVRSGSPLLPHLNKVVHRVTVAGLYFKWLNDVQFQEILSGELIGPKQPLAPTAIQFEHLQCAFYILAAGLTLATAVFFIEVNKVLQCCHFFSCRRQVHSQSSLKQRATYL